MSLSLYRIDRSLQMKALFIACATVNSVYCCMSDRLAQTGAPADLFSNLGPCHGLE